MPSGRGAHHPSRPADLDVRNLPRQLGRQEIGGHRRDEHRARHRRRRKRRPAEIGADGARVLCWRRTIEWRDVLHHRIDHAAAARHVGRHEWREDEIGKRDRIAQPQRASAERPDEQERDATPESGDLVTERKGRRRKHQPDDIVAETRERPAHGRRRRVANEPKRGRGAEADEANHGRRHGLGHETGHDECEERRVMPGGRGQAGRNRQQQERAAEPERHDPLKRQHDSRWHGDAPLYCAPIAVASRRPIHRSWT